MQGHSTPAEASSGYSGVPASAGPMPQDHTLPLLPPLPGFRIQRCASFADVPFDVADSLLREHARIQYDRLVSAGGPSFDVMAHIDASWREYDTFAAPNGSFYLVWSDEGAPVGCAALKRISPTAGELKHLYVRSEARRRGVGRRLAAQRIADARNLGLKTLYTDTFAINREMPALYDSLGFRRVDPLAHSAALTISPELLEWMLFFEKDLTAGDA